MQRLVKRPPRQVPVPVKTGEDTLVLISIHELKKIQWMAYNKGYLDAQK